MVTQTIVAENSEERLIWRAVTWTFPLYFLGALYISGPVFGWCLFALWFKRNFIQTEKPGELRYIPLTHWLWVMGMLGMLVALFVGHMDYQLGTAKLIKSSVGWAKGWALLALFIIAGNLAIRPQLVYRAIMHLSLHCLLLIPIFVLAWLVGLPQTPYVSPLKVIGGPGPEFFALSLYEIDPGSGLPRWRMFTPWAPALGFVANIFFVCALAEKNKFWRSVGITAAIMMILMSQSRLALVSLIALLGVWTQMRWLKSYTTAFIVAAVFTVIALFAEPLLHLIEQIIDGFVSARADSSRVRAALARIALERWSSEAYWFGHGIVERGPHLVEYMPIGSHHTWYGLLFVKGLIGLLALAIPMAISFIHLVKHCANAEIVQVSLCMILILFLYTFGENLEILAYLIWPALLLIGMGHSHIANQHSTQEAVTCDKPLANNY